MKLRAAAMAETDTVLHLDSDTAFVRPLGTGRHAARRPRPPRPLPRRGPRRDAHPPGIAPPRACSTLPASDYHGADYIDNFVPWRRANVRGLLERIAAVRRTRPDGRYSRAPRDFSEYILYGVYCDRVLGLGQAGHFAADESLCETIWSEGADGLPLAPGVGRYGIGIQSTIALDALERRRIIAEAIVGAARADGTSAVPEMV